MPDDEELVRSALNGHRGAYEDLVHRWGRRVVALCHARVSDAEVAEDLAQETLFRGWKRLQSLRQPEDFGPWLRKIAEHVCLDWIRQTASRRAAHERMLMATSPAPSTGEMAASTDAGQRDENHRVLTEVNELPETLREVVLLRYYDDITYDEIAELLGIARATVNARLSRARCLLARRLATLLR